MNRRGKILLNFVEKQEIRKKIRNEYTGIPLYKMDLIITATIWETEKSIKRKTENAIKKVMKEAKVKEL